MKFVWVEKDKKIDRVLNEEMKVYVKWSKEPDEDYAKLSRHYINAGFIALKEVIEGSHNNNSKYDTWFLPGVYMLRHSIELLIKAGLASKGTTKNELQKIFFAEKHNVMGLYKTYKDKYGVIELKESEQEWIEKYLESIEVVDSNSDLFRYPFKDAFLQQYADKSLDIYHMSNRLISCYSTLHKIIYGEWFNEVKLNLAEDPEFLKLASSAIHNCYLWDSPWSNGFYKQVIGYRRVAEFLFTQFKESKDEALFYPIVFLMRNAIEIGLKRLLHINMDQSIDEKIIRRSRNSHLLYKDLWKSIKPILVHYAQEDHQKEETLDLAESYIMSLDCLDKKDQL